MKRLIITACVLAMATVSAQAAVYTDATNDAVDVMMDITQVEVTQDATNLNFVITLADAGIASNEWARFGFGIDSTTNGSTTADAWNDKIIMSSGMDFWGGGWTVSGTNSAGLNLYDATLGDWPEWQNGGDGSTWLAFTEPVFSSNTISFGVSMSALGLSAGDSFDFDVYTFWNDGFPSDALGTTTMIPWAQYDSGTNVVSYTIDGGGPVYGDPAQAHISLAGTNVVIEFLAESNVAYYVQSSSSLSTQSWNNVSALIVGAGATNSTSLAPANPVQFYRVIQP